MAGEVHINQQAQSITDTEIDLYTVTTAKLANVTVHWNETAGGTSTVRIAVRLGGAALSAEQYRVFDRQINPRGSESTLPLLLNAGDVITVRANNTGVNFHSNSLEFTY